MATDLRLKETELQTVTEQLVESYSACGRLHHLGHEPLPNADAVADILADLHEVLYPGYGRKQALHPGNIVYHVGTSVRTIDIATGLARTLLRAAAEPVGLSLEGRRLAWAENLKSSARIRVLYLASS